MMHTPDIHARARDVALTQAELATASAVLEEMTPRVCVATVQRRVRVGWNRAVDLIVHLKGFDALPEVAKRSFQS